jgi:hypothetical protein
MIKLVCRVEDSAMHRTALSIPEIALIAGTRAALGAGVGLLLADRLSKEQRRAVGWTLVAVGAITTVPIAVQLLRSQHEESGDERGDERGDGSGGRHARMSSRREYAAT